MSHAPSKAEACHQALEVFAEEHRHAPCTQEKARLLSDTIKEWEHEYVEAMHSTDAKDCTDSRR
jgi:hypothetical protein